MRAVLKVDPTVVMTVDLRAVLKAGRKALKRADSKVV